jgi:hypothetical protein
MATCKECGVEIHHDRHRFTDDHTAGGVSKIKDQYCDDHCPRCDPEKINVQTV